MNNRQHRTAISKKSQTTEVNPRIPDLLPGGTFWNIAQEVDLKQFMAASLSLEERDQSLMRLRKLEFVIREPERKEVRMRKNFMSFC